MYLQNLLVCVMVTSCAVVGCARCNVKGMKIDFYCFSQDGGNRRLWIGALWRMNPDRSDSIPGEGDRVCGDHFTTGEPHKDPSHPDYVQSVAMRYDCPRAESGAELGQSRSRHSLGRFDRAQQRREAWIGLAAEAAVNAEHAQLLLQVQQKRVRQEHCHAICDVEPEPATKRLQPPGGLLLQTGGNNGEIAAEVGVSTDWTIQPSSCSGDPYVKGAQLEEKLKDVEKENKALREQVTSGSKKKVFGVDLIKDNDKKTQYNTGLWVGKAGELTTKQEFALHVKSTYWWQTCRMV